MLAQLGPLGADIAHGRLGPEALLLPVMALFYLIPFVCVLICWWLWRRIIKPDLSERQADLCLVGIWLLTLTLYLDVIFVLPFEAGSAAERQVTMRVLGPVLAGIFLSPFLTMLGALAGIGGYRLAERWNGSMAVTQLAFTIAIAGLQIVGLFLLGWIAGGGAIAAALGLVGVAIIGATDKRYAQRQPTE
ncbi:MAG TPA: hypothetical protein VH743_01205 [Beijerinckiaceae bacterium]